MEKVLDINGFANVKENHIIGRPSLYKNSEISFSGTNNAIYFGSDINLINCKFTFNCSNSLIYLKGGCNINNLNAIMHNDCVFYLGKKVYLNPSTVGKYILMISEHKHIFIGNNCLFSTGISFRTADAHLIYSIETKQRLNSSKSIFVGDSVWIGQNAMLMKGAKIHSGSIIGAGSVISNKEIPSNSSGGGNPIRVIKNQVFWKGNCTNKYTQADSENFLCCNNTENIFSYDEEKYISFDWLDELFSEKISALEKIEKIKLLSEDKNRFAKF